VGDPRATMDQEIPRPADTPHNTETRARIRAFSADGVERFGLATAVEVPPALLHASVLLFYMGLVGFLSIVNQAYLSQFPITPLTLLVRFVIEAAPLLLRWLRPLTNGVKKAIHERRTKIEHGVRHSLRVQVDDCRSDSRRPRA
jgi:hypothetical protein